MEDERRAAATARIVSATVTYRAPCRDCGAEAECHGVQALVDGRLRWDVETACAACGAALAVCGAALPPERREQLLAEHGPATLRVLTPPPTGVPVMRVLRAALGVGPASARTLSRRVLAGGCSGTLPEMELLAGKLRASGIDAVAAAAER
ncbi:hypothetical protein [Streptomyces huiliensis]|uniref:hypothetical protein n=1 Tax=Streptomyces huiliensis TaxID=2876027 RepID=UPI001CBC1D34|nr:hypothetical protein [Streptomyces huiliensis]MBZ4323586.1 hypothetical protein [Streptomyces huiliensis]